MHISLHFSYFLSSCSLKFQIKHTMDRSWSHECRIPVASLIFAFITIVVAVVLLVIRIDESPRYCRICQRGGFAAILAGNAAIFVPLVAPVKFRGTALSHILLRLYEPRKMDRISADSSGNRPLYGPPRLWPCR